MKVKCMECGDEFEPSFSRDFFADDADPSKGRCEGCFMRKAFAPKDPVSITEERAQTICLLGKGPTCCTFLGVTGHEYVCMKGSAFDAALRTRREQKSIGSMGDNCSGPPDFKHHEVLK